MAIKFLGAYRCLSLQLLRIDFTKAYLHGVRLVRLSAIGLMSLGLIIAMMCVGALLVHVGLFILLRWTLGAKAILAAVLGLAYMGISGAVLRAAVNERTWMEKSGASRMLQVTTLQRRFTLNPVISLIFWTWLWGVPGALLSVPILVSIKVVCDRVPGLANISELLGS